MPSSGNIDIFITAVSDILNLNMESFAGPGALKVCQEWRRGTHRRVPEPRKRDSRRIC